MDTMLPVDPTTTIKLLSLDDTEDTEGTEGTTEAPTQSHKETTQQEPPSTAAKTTIGNTTQKPAKIALSATTTQSRLSQAANTASSRVEQNSTTAHSGKVNVKTVLQNPELPTGCEVTSLTMVLNYLGYEVSKLTIADEYLPKENVNCDPYNVFCGNPRSKNAYGCFAPVIVKAANKYLESVGSDYKAVDITGSSPSQLYEYVKQGIPVLVWATIGMVDTYVSATARFRSISTMPWT